MPHLILEYSDNLNVKEGFNTLFKQLHYLLAEMLPTPLDNCKSRCMPQKMFFIGDQNPTNAFVHLTIKIKAGRADSLKTFLGEKALNLLTEFFKEKKRDLKINISVEILDLDGHYFKSQISD
ncbi:MAG: 5-carboxymethyl-2-hydroxymuconate Delta-isomerase [Proteobacteria bacterium]|nr:5-carboxymethyl-2-hydroxymuconate Delta-isomerase [Pseudomonadota bacterium]